MGFPLWAECEVADAMDILGFPAAVGTLSDTPDSTGFN